MITPELLHHISVVLPLAVASVGTGLGQGIAAFGALESLMRQDLGKEQSFRAMVIGLALTESAVVIALVVTILTLFGIKFEMNWAIAISELGIALAISFAAFFVSLASSFAVKSACISITRQPFAAQKILTLMLVLQSLIEAALIFAFIIVLFIRASLTDSLNIYEGFKLLSAGAAIGLGCIGPLIGQAIFVNKACMAIGLNKDAYHKILPYSLLSEAAIETPLIFSLLVAFLILYMPLSSSNYFLSAASCLIAAITISLGALGGAIASGKVSSKGCVQVALQPEAYPSLIRSTLLAQAFVESTVIYSLIVALFLIIKKI